MNDNRAEIRRIMICVNVIEGIYEMIAKKIGIKENALTLLYALDDGKTHSQKEICEEWLIPKTTLNTIVKECVKEGMIILENADRNKEKVICLTEKGHEFAQKILHQVYQIEQLAMQLTREESSLDFIDGMVKFADNLKSAVDQFSHTKNK